MTVRVKPRLRGVFHEGAFYLALCLAVPLALTAEPGRARISAIVFSTCLAVCFGASALYHRPTWSPRPRAWLARLDHAGIYLLIAGTYTPFGLLVLSRGWAIPVLGFRVGDFVAWGQDRLRFMVPPDGEPVVEILDADGVPRSLLPD